MKSLSIIFLFLICSCSSMEDSIEFVSYDGFEMKQAGSKQLEFNVKITVKNNLFVPVKMKPSTFDFGLDQESLGLVSTVETVKIKAHKKTELVIPVQLKLENGSFLNLMSYTQKESAKLHLNGDARAKVLFVSKNVPVNLTKTFSPKSFNPFPPTQH